MNPYKDFIPTSERRGHVADGAGDGGMKRLVEDTSALVVDYDGISGERTQQILPEWLS